MVEIQPLKSALSDLFAQATIRGKLTLADRYGILAHLLHEETLSDEERAVIDRLLHSAVRGRITLVDEVSALWNESSH